MEFEIIHVVFPHFPASRLSVMRMRRSTYTVVLGCERERAPVRCLVAGFLSWHRLSKPFYGHVRRVSVSSCKHTHGIDIVRVTCAWCLFWRACRRAHRAWSRFQDHRRAIPLRRKCCNMFRFWEHELLKKAPRQICRLWQNQYIHLFCKALFLGRDPQCASRLICCFREPMRLPQTT